MADGQVPAWKPDEVIHEGAEATVTGGSWMGNRAVLKVRRPRSYRHPDLDRRLTRQRLAAEARILSRLSSEGFPSPDLMFLDQRSSSILMSRIEGSPLHDLLKSGEAGPPQLTQLGALIRSLHEVGVSHGDLTTHNVMVGPHGNLHLIDFGLSRQSPELEQLGLDLQVLNECLGASHSAIPDGMETVCDGYLGGESEESEVPTAHDVVERFRKITGRVRYHG
tara:strand:- start:23657 stop:24322 length:666 start_codon:yes stop_codon:yes gene_type:complete